MLSLLMRFRLCVFWFMILNWMEVIPVDGQCTFKSCMTDGDEDLSICTQQNEGAQHFYQFDKRFSVLEHLVEKQGQFFDGQIRNIVNILDKNETGGFEEHDGQLSQLLNVLEQVKVLTEQVITQSETLGQNNNNNSEARILNISEHLETLQGRLNRRLSVLEENFEKQGKNLKALPDQITKHIQLLSKNISNRWEVNDGQLVQSLRALEERIKQQDQDVKVTILRQNITNHLGQRIEQQGQILTNKIISQAEILGQNIRDYGRNFTERLEEVTGQISQRFEVMEQRTEHQDKSLETLSYRQERHDGNLQNISQVLINIILSQAQILGQNIRDYGRNLTNRLDEVTGQIDQRLHVLEQVVANQSKSLETISYSMERQDGNLQNISHEEHLTTIYLRNTSDTLRQSSAATPADCKDIRTATTGYLPNGVYEILLHTGLSQVNVSVYCEFSASGDSWMIIQRRYDGSVNFSRRYSEYSKGFGDLNGEFWLGNEMLHLLTSKRNYKLRIELEDWDGNARYAEYSNFKIGSSVTNFILNISGYSGNAGDGMADYNGERFGTRDFDARNDCYKYHDGGWWYHYCSESTVNGIYHHGKYTGHVAYNYGLVWEPWLRYRESLKKTKMKISAVV